MDTGYPIFSYIAVSLLWLCIPISGKWRDVVGFLQESEDSFPSNRGLSHPRVIKRAEDDLRVVRLESPAHTGGGSSAECSHAGLSPRALDVVTPVQRLPVGAFAMAGARDGGCSNGSLG